MTDGIGRRIAATDPATGEPVEHLELATELVLHTAFATALAERVTRLSAVRHASYVHVRRVDECESIDELRFYREHLFRAVGEVNLAPPAEASPDPS